MHAAERRTPSFWIAFTLILILAAVTRFSGLGRFPHAVFDEVYYVSFAAAYLDGTQAFWEAHPPLGKLIYAAVGRLTGLPPGTRFTTGDEVQPFGNIPYLPLRATAAAAGTLLVAFLMLLGYEISGAPAVGLLAGFLGTLENGLILESRYVLLNVFLLLFGTAGLWCFFRARRARREGRGAATKWLLLSGVLFGLAGSVKITGFVFLAVAWFLHSMEPKPERIARRRAFLVFFAVPAALFLAINLLHFALFPREGSVLSFFGPSKVAFIEDIREKLPRFIPGTFMDGAAVRLAEATLSGLLTVSVHFIPLGHHPAASPWYSWPILFRGIPYVSEHPGDYFEHVIWLGNPLLWWGGLFLIGAAVILRIRRALPEATDGLLFGYLLNLLALSTSPRELFIYLYLPSLIFLILISAQVLGESKKQGFLVGCFLLLVLASFLFFSPLTYGFPLSEAGILLREWLPGWKTL